MQTHHVSGEAVWELCRHTEHLQPLGSCLSWRKACDRVSERGASGSCTAMGPRRRKAVVIPPTWQSLESIGPPPGLERIEEPRESPEPPAPRESPEPPGPPESPEPPTQRESPVPPGVGPLMLIADPSAITPWDIQATLKWWILESRRLLLEEVFGVATSPRSTARSSTEPPVNEVVPRESPEPSTVPRESPEPPTVRERPADACGAQLVKHRPEVANLSQALYTANTLDWMSMWNLAVLVAHFLGLIELLAHPGGRPSFQALTPCEQALQNVFILALCVGLDEEGLATMRQQGLPKELKALVHDVLTAATNEDSGDLHTLLFSRLGVAKYHLFTEGHRFSRRKARVKEKNAMHIVLMTYPQQNTMCTSCRRALCRQSDQRVSKRAHHAAVSFVSCVCQNSAVPPLLSQVVC